MICCCHFEEIEMLRIWSYFSTIFFYLIGLRRALIGPSMNSQSVLFPFHMVLGKGIQEHYVNVKSFFLEEKKQHPKIQPNKQSSKGQNRQVKNTAKLRHMVYIPVCILGSKWEDGEQVGEQVRWYCWWWKAGSWERQGQKRDLKCEQWVIRVVEIVAWMRTFKDDQCFASLVVHKCDSSKFLVFVCGQLLAS